jgi:hypothetical protein
VSNLGAEAAHLPDAARRTETCDLMTGVPAGVDATQRKELGIKI